ncbi:MAG: hypothetical protein ACC645_23495 [Pirellulales bacterium]
MKNLKLLVFSNTAITGADLGCLGDLAKIEANATSAAGLDRNFAKRYRC